MNNLARNFGWIGYWLRLAAASCPGCTINAAVIDRSGVRLDVTAHRPIKHIVINGTVSV